MKRRTMIFGAAMGIAMTCGVVGAHQLAWADVAAESPDAHAAATGPRGWVSAALEQVDLRPEQRTLIQQMGALLEAQSAPARAAHERAVEAVAASIESGVFDHAAIDPLVTAAEAAHATTAPLLEAAAQRLHDTLDASQRQALVDALQARHAGKHGHHPFALGGEHGHEPLTLVADALGLDTAQRATIHERFRAARGEEAAHPHGDRAAHRARLRAIADAFVSDAFDAHALGLGAMAAHEHPRGHRLALLEAALPVLTPVQRASLARMVRSGAI